ncbi:GspH/FimT family pseudopilin, partial [bacterium]|nr:GspH/FimT family pseudopilin [bacterium]
MRWAEATISRTPSLRSSATAGFTLIELLLVLLILATLAGLSIPRFAGTRDERTVEEQARLLTADLQRGRLEAVRRGRTVVVRPTATGYEVVERSHLATHDPTEWTGGAAVTAFEESPIRTGVLTSGISLRLSPLEFFPDGTSSGGSALVLADGSSLGCLLQVDPVLGSIT